MFNILASGFISSIFFGILVFYFKINEYVKNKDFSKEEAFNWAKNYALEIIKIIAGIHALIALIQIINQ